MKASQSTVAQDMDELVDQLDGRLMYPDQVDAFLKRHAPLMRKAWAEFGELLFIGFGMDDGDYGFTVTARWERP